MDCMPALQNREVPRLYPQPSTTRVAFVASEDGKACEASVMGNCTGLLVGAVSYNVPQHFRERS